MEDTMEGAVKVWRLGAEEWIDSAVESGQARSIISGMAVIRPAILRDMSRMSREQELAFAYGLGAGLEIAVYSDPSVAFLASCKADSPQVGLAVNSIAVLLIVQRVAFYMAADMALGEPGLLRKQLELAVEMGEFGSTRKGEVVH